MKKIIAIILTVITVVACVSMFAACGNDDGEAVIKMIDIELTSEDYGYAIKNGNTELLNNVNAFFVAKKSEIENIFVKYTKADADLESYGKAYKTTSTDRANELVVATNLDFAPFEYVNGNKIAGIDMEIAELLAAYLGKTLVVKDMEFDAVVPTIQNLDTCDIGMAGLSITPARAELITFSNPYYNAAQVLVVKEGDSTFAGCNTKNEVEAKLRSLSGKAANCGAQTGTTSVGYIEGDSESGFDGFSNLTCSPYDSAALAIQDMLNGNLSFVVVDKTTAIALVRSFNN